MSTNQTFLRLHYCDYKPTLQERYDCYSRWNLWGRWMILGMALVGIILLFTYICCTNQRRASHGEAPIKYTGWITPGFVYPPQQYSGYSMQPIPYTSPAPPYEFPAFYQNPNPNSNATQNPNPSNNPSPNPSPNHNPYGQKESINPQ
ncbi:hypothetical protein PCK1_001379 [Pneumocystis canis]|nr:hypothetical protein PCK1_001379 [Pneumocystis canis]